MNAYFLHVAIMVGIFSILSLSLNVIVGFAGLVSLGHAAFFGIGAYLSGILMIKGLSFPEAFLASGAITSVLGLCLALPALRVKDDYLAIVTLGFGIIMMLVFMNLDITGGPDGLTGIPPATLWGHVLSGKSSFLTMTYAVLSVMIVSVSTLKRSRIGRAWAAIRDNDVTASFMGINTAYYKVIAFMTSSFWAGLAGSLYAHYTAYISPPTFGMHTSIMILSMVVLGGIGSITGALLGAALLVLLPEVLRPLAAYQDIIYGSLLVLLMIFRPQGIMGRVKITEMFGRG
ncbi:MAG TPA: branched-chain amino acid ABC transporter permease [Desulfomonilia bacterium]|nr:branched-chain amino acid ABC transporter permease [Desulfomonilia bacterium]